MKKYMNYNLINVFNDTLEFSKKFVYSNTKKFTFDDIVKPTSPDKSGPRSIFNKIKLENMDSVSTLEKYSESGKCCVLNMASYKRPGGGVERGARAQEEGLFRCSNLFTVIDKSHYPLQENECLYTKDAVFFKDFNYNYINPITSDVITIAAINLNNNAKYDDVQTSLDYLKITKEKIRLMLTLPAQNGVDNLILGAWGCGVFKNDPKVMSGLFYDILFNEGYINLYDNVVFGIINDHNSVDNNFGIFNKTFND